MFPLMQDILDTNYSYLCHLQIGFFSVMSYLHQTYFFRIIILET